MKKYFKPILSVFLIVVITFLITRIFYHNFIFNNNISDKNTEIIKSDDLINDDSNSDSNNDKDDENNVDNAEVINIETAKKEDAPPKEEPKNNNSNTNSSSKVDSKEENAWDLLGITEYDYYHKPVWSWARIDYSIEEYKTQENARNACIAEGNRLTREEHIKSGFSCLNVLSYAGNYLGEMLNTF